MRSIIKKPIYLFVLLMLLIALPLVLFPINLFDGEIVYQSGISKIVEPRPLSLHFVAGLEYNKEELLGVEDYYLKPRGWVLAFLFIVGFPALISYRVWVKQKTGK